jgi:hypothetical protein
MAASPVSSGATGGASQTAPGPESVPGPRCQSGDTGCISQVTVTCAVAWHG